MGAVGVVELGAAEAHLHVGYTHMACGAVDDGAVLGLNGGKAGVADGVAEEVGREELVRALSAGSLAGGGLFAEGCEGAVELRSHGVKQDRSRLLLGTGGGQSSRDGADSESQSETGTQRGTGTQGKAGGGLGRRSGRDFCHRLEKLS